jgi:chromosome segregation ATPase
VNKLKSSDTKLNAQSEAHKAEVKGLKKKLAEMNEDFEVAKAKQEISEWISSWLQKNVDELHESKERCYEKSLDCAKKLKDNFAKVGAYSSEQKFIRDDPEGVIQWIDEEAKAFEEYLATVGIFVPSPVPEALQQFWRKLVVNILKLQLRQKLSSP